MANEYLKRTPTSTGNRKVFTWSGWVKSNIDNAPANGNAVFMCAAENDGNLYYRTRLGRYVVNEGDFGFNHYDGANDNYGTQALNRDHSNWEHYICAVDTTQEQTTDRVKLYLNGVYQSDLTTVVAIDKDLDTFMNGNSIHFVGADSWTATPNSYSKLLMSDVFFIDGQALTPDVFGFYKEGDGYVSAGSTQATDFRPGQWVPKRPRVIKTEIERRGGFGVNGFYLPMNDSSNPGADFHCDPNSIITLKGEDLPQPRNGAPTTSDAYVSQLRSDANAANLVLAVPGISTSTSATIVSNGHFDTNTTGWTVGTATGTLVAFGGELEIQRVSTNGTYCTQEITTEAGKRYTVSFDTRSSQAGSSYITKFQIGTSPATSDLLDRIDTDSTTMVHRTASFTATGTTAYVFLGSNYTANSFWDNIVIKQEDAPRDYSADIKGSGSNKTITPNGAAGVGYEIPGYYGSGMSFSNASSTSGDDKLTVTDSDFAMGTGDFTIEAWINPDALYDYQTIFATRPDNGGYTDGFNLWINLQGATGVYSNAFLTQTANGTINANQWTHVVAERYNGTLTTYVNGVAADFQTSNTQDYTRTAASIGQLVSSNLEAFTGQMQDLRVYKGVAKYKGGFDVLKPYAPVGFEGDSWRTVADCTANNFATLNPLDKANNTGTLTDGNLSNGTTSSNNTLKSTIAVSTGKWYWEFKTSSASLVNHHGIVASSRAMGTNYIGQTTDSWGMYENNGNKRNNASFDAYGSAFSAGDIGMVALDKTNGKIWWGKNGTWFTSGDPAAGTNAAFTNINTVVGSDGYVAAATQGHQSCTTSFGQNPTFSGTVTAGTYTDDNGKGLFKYQPPTGFLALCEDNLPAPAISDPGDYFKTVLYAGDGNTGHSITGVGFQPDLVWIKVRNHTGYYHELHDSVRGAGNGLFSNVTDVEATIDTVQSFNTNGFTVALQTGLNGTNQSGKEYVAWCWKAGGAAVSNTDGSIASQVSANQTAGFSIVSYTGGGSAGTIGHGLGTTPKMIIIKNRGDVSGNTRNWIVYHNSLGATQYLRLNDTNAAATLTGVFNDTEPTSSVFSVGNSVAVSENGDGHIDYCWEELEGYSKFGSYTGNGSTDGAFVYCGFKPAFVMLKASSTTGNWCMIDNARNSTNPTNFFTVANAANAGDDTGGALDFVSNGFKLRLTSANFNGSGTTYVFAAFAESPFKTANAK